MDMEDKISKLYTAQYGTFSFDDNGSDIDLKNHQLSPESPIASEDKMSLDENPMNFIDECLSSFLQNDTFPDRERTPLISHCFDVENLLTKEVNCDDQTAIIAAKVGGMKHLMLEKDFCETLKMDYGEETFAACFQIATYDYHDKVVDCKCRELGCHANGNGKWGFDDVWICFCNASGSEDIPGPSSQGWKVLKNKIGCYQEEVLEECLRKRRKNKLRAMCESAKMALLGWMVVMVRKFKEGYVPVDWHREKIDRYIKDLVEMWKNLGIEETQKLSEWLVQHPSNKIILKLRMIFLKEIRIIKATIY